MRKKRITSLKEYTLIKNACHNCKYCDECCSTDYRTVKYSGGILALNMDLKMKKYENILSH